MWVNISFSRLRSKAAGSRHQAKDAAERLQMYRSNPGGAMRFMRVRKNGDSLSRVFTLWVCRLPMVNWSFHPVLIGGKQRQARVASCSLEILYVEPLQGLEEGTLSPELAKNILSFGLEAKITLKKITQVNCVGMLLLVNPGDYVYQLSSEASSR